MSLLESGTDIRTVQDLLGHASVEPSGRDRLERSDSPQGGRGGEHQTTMIYLHVIKRPGAGAPSPLDFG